MKARLNPAEEHRHRRCYTTHRDTTHRAEPHATHRILADLPFSWMTYLPPQGPISQVARDLAEPVIASHVAFDGATAKIIELT